MGENLDVPGRLSVRTPMQWAPEPSGGFTAAPLRRLARPFPGGLYAPKHVNVLKQRHDPTSLWWFMRNLIRLRKQHPHIGWSTIEVLRTRPHSVFAHLARESSGWTMLAVHNFAPESTLVDVTIDDVPDGSILIDLLDDREETPIEAGGRVELGIDGHGYRWLLVHRPGDRPAK